MRVPMKYANLTVQPWCLHFHCLLESFTCYPTDNPRCRAPSPQIFILHASSVTAHYTTHKSCFSPCILSLPCGLTVLVTTSPWQKSGSHPDLSLPSHSTISPDSVHFPSDSVFSVCFIMSSIFLIMDGTWYMSDSFLIGLPLSNLVLF